MGEAPGRWGLAMAVVYLTGLALSLPVRWGPVDRIDERLTTAVVGWVGRHRIVRETALVVTNLGAPVLLALVVAIGAGLLWRRGDLNGARTLLLCGVLGAVVETALKLTVARARPDLDSLVTARGTSFPSGHAMNSMIVWVSTMWLLARPAHSAGRPAARVRSWSPGPVIAGAATLAVLVGSSRVALGAHHPGDVAAGWLLAGMWLLLLRRLVVEPGR
ncbi:MULTISPECIES: phosphatase PAP2 family protein [Candidatus Microthrix]|uniref:phosphatase PAP2 family protein n=1 Tax=Candidatus Neomicrothrix TaxID=41949 RepID=UPI000374B7C2|nr:MULTISPECIES: phosphatase PAP2 family protein [Microthrix]NLH68091.1 phosphatase PAP2 family protein [Candidatus Microthrix parvicella]MBK6502993.1 phosphatase PAP2 family protein [Candidatus Microthrix sp.]MBK7321812.1 phosphatase PAP2 family protein [Candidatus Microthrix sp.]MBL0204202.1 phosphatase PAP2 family protein [Candidatus Microthrix sp.]MBP6134924.1 phosphatase PAP2 family protein [Candidatus Microthrix sp.]